MSNDSSKTMFSLGMLQWGLQIATLVALAILGTLFYSNQQSVRRLEEMNARLVEQKLQFSANTDANSTKLIESLTNLSSVLDRTNRAYETALAKIATMREEVHTVEKVTQGAVLRK